MFNNVHERIYITTGCQDLLPVLAASRYVNNALCK